MMTPSELGGCDAELAAGPIAGHTYPRKSDSRSVAINGRP
jgi:hypothetical protein